MNNKRPIVNKVIRSLNFFKMLNKATIVNKFRK